MEKVGLQKYLNEIGSPSHEDLVALNAMYHPGTLEKIPHYIARKQGIEPIEYIHPVMEKHLKETYGILVYQEQIKSLCQDIANFSSEECTELCEMITRLMVSPRLEVLHNKFICQGLQNGYDEPTLERIWLFLERNALYITSKSEPLLFHAK